ncbi:MAG: GlxA family transcriptional regulator [Pseudomonadota bacterium]
MYDPEKPCEIVILVAPKYSQLTLAALVEPMRMANTVSDRRLYTWTLCSDGRDRVDSSSGFTLTIDKDIAAIEQCDALFVVASYEARQFVSTRVVAFLRRMARRDAVIGGLDAAPFILAEAGLLDGHRATTHWDDLDDFQERYPRIDVVSERYVVDRRRATTSGSLPSFDFTLDFIRQREGLALAMNVSGNFLYDQARPGSEPQFMIATSRIAARHPKITKVIKLMEQTLQAPLPMTDLAASVGLSERSLLRRFREALNVSPHTYYRELRLDVGRRLLDNSDLSVTEVALACGFDSRAAFTRAFKDTFGTTPLTHRRASSL